MSTENRRDNFSAKTKRVLGERVGYRCSGPKCRRLTVGPTKDISAPLRIAEAAHIAAAAEGGPRFDSNLTPEERCAIENGIWLCATCHTMVDKDRNHFTNELLREWKGAAEELARKEVEGELIFSGYVDPAKAAAAHFSEQLQQYLPARKELGCIKVGGSPEEVPLVWIQLAATASLKGLVQLPSTAMNQYLNDVKPVICRSWGTEVSRFGVHVSGYGYGVEGNGTCLQSLVQLFKDGSLAIGFVMFEHTGIEFGFDYVKSRVIPWIAFEDRVLTSVQQGIKVLAGLEFPQLAFVRLTVMGMLGYGVTSSPDRWTQHKRCDTDTVQTAATLIRGFDLPAAEIARPLLDAFWQHLGVWRSPSYNDAGAFIRKTRL